MSIPRPTFEEDCAFHDALAKDNPAREVMGNELLRIIAAELVTTVRQNAGVHWWTRDNIRSRMKVAVKKILQARLAA